MTNCKYITKNGRCGLKGSYAYRHGCFGEDMCRCREPMTNADRIRSMNDEELAEVLIDLADDGNLKIKEWLQQTAGEEDKHELVER